MPEVTAQKATGRVNFQPAPLRLALMGLRPVEELWIASILAHLRALFQSGETVGMYDK